MKQHETMDNKNTKQIFHKFINNTTIELMQCVSKNKNNHNNRYLYAKRVDIDSTQFKL